MCVLRGFHYAGDRVFHYVLLRWSFRCWTLHLVSAPRRLPHLALLWKVCCWPRLLQGCQVCDMTTYWHISSTACSSVSCLSRWCWGMTVTYWTLCFPCPFTKKMTLIPLHRLSVAWTQMIWRDACLLRPLYRYDAGNSSWGELWQFPNVYVLLLSAVACGQ